MFENFSTVWKLAGKNSASDRHTWSLWTLLILLVLLILLDPWILIILYHLPIRELARDFNFVTSNTIHNHAAVLTCNEGRAHGII